MPTTAERRAPLWRTAVVSVAAAALAATAEMHWVRAGNGSTLTGLDLAAALRQNVLVADSGQVAAALIYACVLAGLACLATAALRVRSWVVFRLVVSTALVVAAGVVVIADLFSPSNWDLGPTVAVCAAAAIGVVAIFELRGASDT